MDYGKVILPAEAGSEGLGFRAFAASRSSAARASARRARSESCVGSALDPLGRTVMARNTKRHLTCAPIQSRIALALSLSLSLSRALSISLSRSRSPAPFGCACLCSPRPVRVLR